MEHKQMEIKDREDIKKRLREKAEQLRQDIKDLNRKEKAKAIRNFIEAKE